MSTLTPTIFKIFCVATLNQKYCIKVLWILIFNWFMSIKKDQKIKAQEWVVMFDGQIKKSEKEIDAYEHHLKVNNQKSEE